MIYHNHSNGTELDGFLLFYKFRKQDTVPTREYRPD